MTFALFYWQVWLSVLYALAYMLFNLFYTIGGGTSKGRPYIYSILDWKGEPELASIVSFLIVFFAFPAVFFACRCLAQQRSKLSCHPPAHLAHTHTREDSLLKEAMPPL